MKYVKKLRMPANVTKKDLVNKKYFQSCKKGNFTCPIIDCGCCMLSKDNKVYFDHWFKTMYKGERLKKGKMSIKLDGKEL